MTRLQKAKKQLNEALVVLESAVEQTSSATQSPNKTQIKEEKDLSANMPELLDEVSIIETKLSEAIEMIASMEASESADEDPK